jgi:hypothetical protein
MNRVVFILEPAMNSRTRALRSFSALAFTGFALMLLFCRSQAQIRQAEFKLHDRGDLWETMKDDGTIGAPNPTNRYEFYPSMDWPAGPHTLISKDDQRSYSLGAGLWIAGKKTGGAIFMTENGPFSNIDKGTFSPIVKQTNFAGSTGYDPREAEELITADFTTTENVRVRRVSRAWSFPGMSNTLLIDYTFTNQNSATLTDVYIGFPYLIRPSYQDFVVHNGWGDDLNRADDLVGYDPSLRLLYSYDDSPNFSLPNDVGNYWASVNEMRTTGYAGFSLVYADTASDRRAQPASVYYAQLLGNETYFTLASNTAATLYGLLDGTNTTNQAPAGQRLSPFLLMSCGPYTVPAGGSVHIVIAHGVNGLPLSAAVQGIAAQTWLPAGRDSLRAAITRARTAFNAGYALASVPPPAPSTTIVSLPSSRSIAVTWPPIENSYTNPLTGRSDLSRYRIYRASRSFGGPYTMIRELRAHDANQQAVFFDAKLGVWKYLDQSISLGVSYFYAVTSVDSTGRESGMTNRNETAVVSSAPPADDAAGVVVFPNPFRRVSGFPTLGEQNSIVWSNLPRQCTIKLYTSGGELFRTIEHQSQTLGQEVWNQLTDARQVVAPGIYFWTVESAVGNARGSLLIIK